MSRDEVKKIALNLLREQCAVDPETVQETSTLEDHALDSLDWMELVIAMEEALLVQVDDVDVEVVKNFAEFVDLFEREKNGK